MDKINDMQFIKCGICESKILSWYEGEDQYASLCGICVNEAQMRHWRRMQQTEEENSLQNN